MLLKTFASLIPPPLRGGPPVHEVTGDHGPRSWGGLAQKRKEKNRIIYYICRIKSNQEMDSIKRTKIKDLLRTEPGIEVLAKGWVRA